MHSQMRLAGLAAATVVLGLTLIGCGPSSAFDSPEDELAYSELQKDFEYRPLDFLDEAHAWLDTRGFEGLETQVLQVLEDEIGDGKNFRDPDRVVAILEKYEGVIDWAGLASAKANSQADAKDKSVKDKVAAIAESATGATCDLDFAKAKDVIDYYSWQSSWEQDARTELSTLGLACAEWWTDYFLEQQEFGNNLLTIEWVNLLAAWDPEGIVTTDFLSTYGGNLD